MHNSGEQMVANNDSLLNSCLDAVYASYLSTIKVVLLRKRIKRIIYILWNYLFEQKQVPDAGIYGESWFLFSNNLPLFHDLISLIAFYIGFLLKHEAEILSNYDDDLNRSRLSLHVINWALVLVRDGRERGFFENPGDATRLLDPLIAFKKSCSVVLKYQITAIPLSFVQVRAFQILYPIHQHNDKRIQIYNQNNSNLRLP